MESDEQPGRQRGSPVIRAVPFRQCEVNPLPVDLVCQNDPERSRDVRDRGAGRSVPARVGTVIGPREIKASCARLKLQGFGGDGINTLQILSNETKLKRLNTMHNRLFTGPTNYNEICLPGTGGVSRFLALLRSSLWWSDRGGNRQARDQCLR